MGQGSLNPAMDESGQVTNTGPGMPYRLDQFAMGINDAPTGDFSPCAAQGCAKAASPLSWRGKYCSTHGGM